MLPFYRLRRIPNIEFALMEKIYNNLSLVKMPHSSFKRKVTDNGIEYIVDSVPMILLINLLSQKMYSRNLSRLLTPY